MNTNVELITIPVAFLIDIEDKVKLLRESLIGKQTILTKVMNKRNMKSWKHKTVT